MAQEIIPDTSDQAQPYPSALPEQVRGADTIARLPDFPSPSPAHQIEVTATDEISSQVCVDPACRTEKNNLIQTIRRISDKDAVSRAIENFEVIVRHGVARGVLAIDDLLDVYKAIKPSLHRLATNPLAIDVDAMGYAIARLPATITGVRRIFVTPRISDIEDYKNLKRVHELSRARRRPTFQAPREPSEITMVAPAGISEILDLTSLLCTLRVEAQKMRTLLTDPARTDLLEQITTVCARVGTPDGEDKDALFHRLSFLFGTTFKKLLWLDERWEGQLLPNIHCLATQAENIHLFFHTSISGADYSKLAEVWFDGVLAEMQRQKLLDRGRAVHVISSNTHSVLNLVSSYPRVYRQQILEWAAASPEHRELVSLAQDEPTLIYYLQKEYLDAHPEERPRKRKFDEGIGITIIEDPVGTGLECQLIDATRLDLEQIDPRLLPELDRDCLRRERPIIINFDYAFGEQGERIMGAICYLRKAIASISIMGKAGTVVGARGGILIPCFFVKQGTDDVYDFPNSLRSQDFRPYTDRSIHAGGPMLTVLGTILQNNDVLEYYRIKWQILGLEMEAIPYIKRLKQSLMLGFFRDDIHLNVAYYASDAPLNPGQTLAEDLGETGLEPVYAITLAVLSKIL